MARAPGIVLVSFTTRPGLGSEGGVGWAFLRAATLIARDEGYSLHALLDQRDIDHVCSALKAEALEKYVVLHPISVGRVVRRVSGHSRSRLAYLSWRRSARREMKRIASRSPIQVVHQVTFATAVLPPVLAPRHARWVWGPVAAPPQRWAWNRNDIIRTVLSFVARRNASRVDLLVATNTVTSRTVGVNARALVVEPNIVVDRPDVAIAKDPTLLTLAGRLIPLKRPMLALEALADPRLSGFRLQVVGDGDLRHAMEKHADDLGVAGRVTFRGRLERDEALRAIAESRVLVHPSEREGAAWVVGEAASVGVPAVVFRDAGADSTVRLSANGGVVCSTEGDLASNLADGILVAAASPPASSERWSSDRLPELLREWWQLD